MNIDPVSSTTSPVLSTVEDAAHSLGVNPSTVYNQVRKGGMPHYRLGRYIRIDVAEVLAWSRQQRQPSDEATPFIHHNPRRKG